MFDHRFYRVTAVYRQSSWPTHLLLEIVDGLIPAAFQCAVCVQQRARFRDPVVLAAMHDHVIYAALFLPLQQFFDGLT